MTELHLRFAPTTLDEAARTVEAIASTGADVARRDAAGPYVERLALAQIDPADVVGVPVLDTHRQDGLERVLGTVTAARLDAGRLVVTLRLSERAAAILADIRDGIVRGVSIGYAVAQWAESREAGQRIKTAIRWAIREVSLVPVPADPGATIRSGHPMETEIDPTTAETTAADEQTRATVDAEIRRICQAAGLERTEADRLVTIGATVGETRSLVLDRLRSQPIVRVTSRPGEAATRADAMADALATRADPARKPGDQAKPYLGMRLPDMARECLRSAGETVTGLGDAEIVVRALSTSDYPLLLAGAFNKVLRPAYEQAKRPIMSLSRERQASDFRPLQRLQVSGALTPLPVGENAAYQHGAFAEAMESYAAKRFGRLASWSPELMVNDDLGFLSTLAPQWAQAWAGFEADQLVALVTLNSGTGPVLGDGNPLFHNAHGNVAAAGGEIEMGTLGAAVMAMRQQRGLAGEVINVQPRYLLVAPTLEMKALSAVATINSVTVDTVNPWSGKFEVLVEPGLTGGAWHLVAGNVEGLEHAYVAGWRGPMVSTERDFATSGTRLKLEGTFGCGFVDWRGWYRNPGQA